MPASQNFGGLPGVSSIFDHGPVWAWVIMTAADIGVIYGLMWVEWLYGGLSPHKRPWYHAQIWADLLFLPLTMAAAAVIAQKAPATSAWYTSPSLHVALLGAALVLSLAVEVLAVRGGQYTVRQELSLSKLWHTMIFSVVGYWMALAVILAIANLSLAPVAALLVIAGLAGFIWSNTFDWKELARDPRSKTDVHMEIYFNPLEFQPRRI